MTDAQKLFEIEQRVRKTICPTFGSGEGGILSERIEGRISEEDFNSLLGMMDGIRADERERCARLHESVDPASDDERHNKVPGAGAMGAVIEYRDLIRAQQ